MPKNASHKLTLQNLNYSMNDNHLNDLNEYKLLWYVDYSFTNIVSVLQILKDAMDMRNINIINVDFAQDQINLLIQYIRLKQRFILLNNKSGQNLSYDQDGFTFNRYMFQTLDEVEKAINAKVFI